MEVGCSSPTASAEGASRWTAQMDGHRTGIGNDLGNRTPLTGQLTHFYSTEQGLCLSAEVKTVAVQRTCNEHRDPV